MSIRKVLTGADMCCAGLHLRDILRRVLLIVSTLSIHIRCKLALNQDRSSFPSVRQSLTVYLLRPLAKYLGIRGAKIERFTERTYGTSRRIDAID